MNTRHILSAAALLAAFGLTACQQSLAYINIPADKGGVAASQVNGSTVAHLEAVAIAAVRAHAHAKGSATVLLPDGSEYKQYQKVVALLGADFVMPDAAAAGTPVYEARTLRARSSEAEVEVVSTGEIRALDSAVAHLEFRTELEGIGWKPDYVETSRVVPAPAAHKAPAKPVEKAPADPVAELRKEKPAEAKPEMKPDAKPEAKPDVKPEIKPAPEKPKSGGFTA